MASLLVDLRCLQDPDYARRGVGQHVRSLLEGGRADAAVTARLRLIGVHDLALPPLAAADRQLVDRLRATAGDPEGAPRAFLSTSPMTHSPLPFARQLADPRIFKAALGYDLIPLDMPGRYLATPAARLAYYTCLTWLRRFDHHFAISRYTARRLAEVLGLAPERLTVTGVAVRPGLIAPAGGPAAPLEPYILVVGGGDPRKNPEVVIDAHAGSAMLNAQGIELLVAGNYPDVLAAPMRQRHAAAGGRPGLVHFLPKLPDAALRALYGSALCVVAPSRIEGFSIPIIEASANGAPVLAADCAAQAELLTHSDDRFPADDADRLRHQLEALVGDPAARAAVLRRQAGLWRGFVQEAVALRFWQPFLAGLDAAEAVPAPAPCRGARPRIAFLSPMPPARSGVADYSRATLAPLAARARVDLYTDTQGPELPAGVTAKGAVSARPHADRRYDAVVSVLGNSHFHRREFELLLRFGGAAIAHDARMLSFYALLLGQERALAVAEAELGRRVGAAELHGWLEDEDSMKALFLGEIAAAAQPMIVHSPVTAGFMAERHGVRCACLPFVPYRSFTRDELLPAHRRRVRAALGVGEDEVIVASFGIVHRIKAIGECLWAVEMLRHWGIPARLVLVGQADRQTAAELDGLAREIGMEGALTLFTGPLVEQAYRDWLLAADVGLQLRTYRLGGLSGAVLDCLAAGLPSVCNQHLAEALACPGFVRRVPDGLSAVLVAEAIAEIVESGQHRARPIEERDALLETRNFDVYAARLMQALGLEPAGAAR